MWTRSEIEKIQELLTEIIDEADAEVLHLIRTAPQRRETLLAELDALERVRGSLDVRFERITSGTSHG